MNLKRTIGWLAVSGAMLVGALIVSQGVRADDQHPPVAYEGHCAVCLVKGNTWVPGSSDHAVVFDGRTYLFPSPAEKAEFERSPESYAPALNGDCIVCLAKAGKRVPGSIKHAIRHENRLYLFPSAREAEMFQQDPAAFVSAEVAAGGECVVCRAMVGKSVPGKQEFIAQYQGLRYLFPSDKERNTFAESPEKFVISAEGKTACAACSYGVHPIGAPSELGLAVHAADDQILIIEDAHTSHPDLYKRRFGGVHVSVVGTPIKTDGKFTWIQPSQLIEQK